MYGLNCDPRHPHGNPAPAELRALGVQMVRFTFKDPAPGSRPDQDTLRFYRWQVESLAEAGIDSLVVLNSETCPRPPRASAPAQVWKAYIGQFAGRAAEIARVLAAWQPAFQVWNAPDLTASRPGDNPGLPPASYGQLLQQTYQAIKAVGADLEIITAGLVSGQPGWLAEVTRSLGTDLPADAVALHLYGWRPSPAWPASDWGPGYVGDLLAAYQHITSLPVWLTEIGLDTLDEEFQATYLRRFYNTLTGQFGGSVPRVFWFCYADGMAYPFGLVTQSGQRKAAYHAYRELATGKEAVAAVAQAAVSLDSLTSYARYLEQNLVFGTRDDALHRQMETDLRWKFQTLSRNDIGRISQHLLDGSSHALTQAEIDSLYALQPGKDLYGMLRSIVSAAHQRTGALTGRIGIHSRISAETDANAATNIDAIMQVLSHVQPGNRMSVMDQVKASADEAKLRAPDVFETDVYGRHRNGLIENHAWNLQRLVRAIRNHGYQDRIILIIRLDGPDNGANVNPFNPGSLLRYELAIDKLIRYLESMLPTVTFKLVLGNEPDLPQERQWSDPHADPRAFVLGQFASATGNFFKKLARQRPDVTFICPALSSNMKSDYLAYYRALFGNDRLENLVPAMHGYSSDVASLPGDQRNLLEQQAEALRRWGGFKHVSGTEVGSGNPFGDVESLSEKGRFDDVVAWLLLSQHHQAPPGQDNNWSFRIDPAIIDPAARHLGDVVNRSKNRVLRNIRERGGEGLQILQPHAPGRPAYGVAYVDHNTPTTMLPGQTRAVQVTLRNTSSRTWAATGPHPVRLGYHWYTSSGAEVPPSLWDDNRSALPHDVTPGGVVSLQCNLNAPRTPARYELRWDLVEEARTWFAWQGVATLDVVVNVVTEGPPAPTEPGQMSVRASHNNVLSGADNLAQALDGNPDTRWSSRATQQPGMWFEIDLNQVRTVSGLALDNAASPYDYPYGYVIRLSEDRAQWEEVARKDHNDSPLDVTFGPRPARYIHIEQTGQSERWWWSIHEVKVRYAPGEEGEDGGEGEEPAPEPPPAEEPQPEPPQAEEPQPEPDLPPEEPPEEEPLTLSVRSSHYNVRSGVDNILQAIDGQPGTRWSSRIPQQPGMWFEIDLNEVRLVSGLALDNAGSPRDYPRGYVVSLSSDGVQWTEVVRTPHNERPLDINFNPQPARYIRVEQTGSDPFYWWSIHGITVRSGPYTPPITASASHDNLLAGADNLAQALDGRPETRWSTRAVQQPGMWFELDLNQVRSVSGLRLDNAGSPNDYPRGYVVRLSTDHRQWIEVARNERNERALDISFAPRQARYIRIEQTGSADRWWWSIHGVTIKG
ncbi:MAG: hypothetical protein Kow0063_38530 [Anaerolineae bacterium]